MRISLDRMHERRYDRAPDVPQATYTVRAGWVHWRGLRNAAFELGLNLDEGRGWWVRTFEFSGHVDRVLRLKNAVDAWASVAQLDKS